MNSQSLDDARNHWKYKILSENLYLASWRILDIFIGLFCIALLTISVVNFKKKYIHKEKNVRNPFTQQLEIFLFSLVPVAYASVFYVIYPWTASLFIIVAVIWALELTFFNSTYFPA